MFHDRPGARVPAQHGVVVARRPNLFRLFIPAHGLLKPVVRDVAGPFRALLEVGPDSPLTDDARIVGPLVLVLKPRQQLSSPRIRRSFRVREPIREGQDKYDDRFLTVGIDPEDVQADTLGLLGFVQETVVLRSFECAGNGLGG